MNSKLPPVPDFTRLRHEAHRILESAWDPYRGYSYPNRSTYPHLWLWDSCFHAIAWASVGDNRGTRELASVFDGQFECGWVPHIRYSREDYRRGPLEHVSSFTQPPIYAHAARYLLSCGMRLGAVRTLQVGQALEALWRHRMHP